MEVTQGEGDMRIGLRDSKIPATDPEAEQPRTIQLKQAIGQMAARLGTPNQGVLESADAPPGRTSEATLDATLLSRMPGDC